MGCVFYVDIKAFQFCQQVIVFALIPQRIFKKTLQREEKKYQEHGIKTISAKENGDF